MKKIPSYIFPIFIAVYLVLLFSSNNKNLNNFKVEAGGGCINYPILNIQNNTLNPSQLYATYRTPSTSVINSNKYAVCVKNYDRIEHTLVAADGKWSYKICSAPSLSCEIDIYLDTAGTYSYHLQDAPTVTGVIIAGNAITTQQSPTSQVTSSTVKSSPSIPNKPSGTPPFGKIRLEEAKLRVCRLREKNITNRSNQMIRHASRMVEVFSSIATRIQNYYLTKLVPRGKTLPNYDALVLDIQTNKNALTPLLAAVQTDVVNFKCDGDNPKGQLDQFKTDMQAVIRGLKTFRISVRNLIVAVASIRGETGGNASGSATRPSITPSASPTAASSVTPLPTP